MREKGGEKNSQKTLFKFMAGVRTTIAAVAMPSEFYTDENNSVNRSAMNTLRYSKKLLPF
jgi:hypothetical protein